MGQCISVPPKIPHMKERSSKPFYRSRNGNLSATFHILDSDMKWDLLNINSATEEQLMTLPGINRVTAENIVEYRQRIGGFKKVEDLALVSGVGASKLEQFRTEICVCKRKSNNGSYDSSLTGSLESLQTDNGSRSSPAKLVNLNTANVFQLMSVCRMTQEMAAQIMHFRERKGPFKTVDDLSKVKGLPPDRLAIVKMYLTVDSSLSNNSSHVNNNKYSHDSMNGRRPIGHRRTNSAPSGFHKSRSCDPSTKDFYDLVSSLVIHPPKSEVFDFRYLGRDVIRLASWNLENFVMDKAKNPGVQEVICRTILENGFSLVAVQEIASKEALQLIVSELNDPKLSSVRNCSTRRGKWHSLVSSSFNAGDNSHKKPLLNGFLYDTSRGLKLQDSSLLHIPEEKFFGLSVNCQPFLGSFKCEDTDFTVVTFSLISESSISKLLPTLLEELKDCLEEKKNIFLVGDFILPPGHTVFEVLSGQSYTHLLPVIESKDEKWNEASHIWASSNVRKLFTGRSGVITQGLSHLAIPDGWKWGGAVSDHSPVWAEMFTKEQASPVNSSLSNGVCKLPAIQPELIADSLTQNLINEKNKGYKFWEKTWTWRYNSKHKVICEKGSTCKENGSL